MRGRILRILILRIPILRYREKDIQHATRAFKRLPPVWIII